MEIFLEILKISIPLILCLLVVYLVIDKFLKNEDKRRNYEIRKKDSSEILRLKLQAYERLILFLERSSPIALVHRLKQKDMNPEMLRFSMVKTIQTEFEHNLVQQIYMSDEAWHFVTKAKDTLINLINNTAKIAVAEKKEFLPALQEQLDELDAEPQDIAIRYLKSEIRKTLI